MSNLKPACTLHGCTNLNANWKLFQHKVDGGAEPLERCAKQMAGVLLHKHCHIVANSWITWEAAEVRAASNFSRCRGGSFGPAERELRGGQRFSFIILLDYSTISNRCFVSGCVFVCVFCLRVVAWWGWMERERGGSLGGNSGGGALEDSTWGER